MEGVESGGDPLDAAWDETRRLEVRPYVADLDANGFTVSPPEIASPGAHGPALCSHRRRSIRKDSPGDVGSKS